MQRGGGKAFKPYSCSIQNKTPAQMHLIAMWLNETTLEETWWPEEHAAFAGMMSDTLGSLWLCCGLCWFNCHPSGRLKLGQVKTKLSLHSSKSCSSKVVAAYMVCSHWQKVLDHRGFGSRHRTSRMTEERVRLGQDELPEINKRDILVQTGLRYLLSSKVDVQPSLQQLIGDQGYTKLWWRSADAS